MRSWAREAWVGAVAAGLIVLAGSPAQAEKWSRAHINALPDEAFAIVEVRPDGKKVRHLPHHDAQGRVDPPHLRNAMSRLHQVHWVDPANADRARQHLVEHFKQLSLRVPGELRASGRAPRLRAQHHSGRAAGGPAPARPVHVIPAPR